MVEISSHNHIVVCHVMKKLTWSQLKIIFDKKSSPQYFIKKIFLYSFVIASTDDSDRSVNKLFVYLDLPPILKIVNQFQD